LHGQALAALGLKFQLVSRSLFAAQHAIEHLPRNPSVFRRNEIRDVHLQRFPPGVAGDGLPCPVERSDLAGQVVDVPDVAAVLYQFFKVMTSLLKLGLKLAALERKLSQEYGFLKALLLVAVEFPLLVTENGNRAAQALILRRDRLPSQQVKSVWTG